MERKYITVYINHTDFFINFKNKTRFFFFYSPNRFELRVDHILLNSGTKKITLLIIN